MHLLSKIDVDDIIKSLEVKDTFKPAQTPIEELQEKQKDTDDVPAMRPVVEDSDEDSVEEEGDLALYRKQKLAEEGGRKKDEKPKHHTEKRRDERNLHKEKYERRHHKETEGKPRMMPYPGYPYHPSMYFYYPGGYQAAGFHLQPGTCACFK